MKLNQILGNYNFTRDLLSVAHKLLYHTCLKDEKLDSNRYVYISFETVDFNKFFNSKQCTLVLTISQSISLTISHMTLNTEKWVYFRRVYIAQKMKFTIKDFSSKCDQIRRKLRIWSHLLVKSLVEKFVFCAVIVEKCFKFIITTKHI